MKDFSYYSQKIPYPRKKDYITVYVYDKGTLLWEGSHESWLDLREDTLKNHPKYVKQEFCDELAYKTAKEVYNKKTKELYDEFKRDLFKEFFVTNNPKAERLFYLCWDRKHDEGYESVYEFFEEFVDLIR